jgi:hypothetical protein
LISVSLLEEMKCGFKVGNIRVAALFRRILGVEDQLGIINQGC